MTEPITKEERARGSLTAKCRLDSVFLGDLIEAARRALGE